MFGKLGDSERISRLTLTQIALLVMAVAACLCPLAHSHSALLTYSVVSGLFDGCLGVMVGLVTHDIVGRKMMAKAVGTMYGIVAIPMTVGPPMAGKYHPASALFNLSYRFFSMRYGRQCSLGFTGTRTEKKERNFM